MREKTCCFTGHRDIPAEQRREVFRKTEIAAESLDKAIRVQRFFRLIGVLSGFVALRSQYDGIPRSGRRAAKAHRLPKIFDLKREDFFVLEVEERRNTTVFQVMRQTKRENTPF